MNTCIRGTLATCSFELLRTLTSQRIAVIGVLAIFPATMLALITWVPKFQGANVQIAFMEALIVMLVGLVMMLSLLLWASTNVYTELEGKSWVFIACRPFGRISMILGKYLAAFILSYTICWTAMTMATIVAQTSGSLSDPNRFWLAMSGLLAIACAAYAAVFTLIGVVFYRRAMVFCAAYMLAIELTIANVPSMFSKFTVRFHLQELLFDWAGWIQFPLAAEKNYRLFFGDCPQWLNFVALLGIVLVCLAGSCFVIVNREYLTADET
jgi:hypothetical protein